MSLDLTRDRKATHENVSVGGSYTDTMITAQGMGNTAKVNDAYIRWVPNNKSGSGYYAGNGVSLDTSKLTSGGYLEFNAKSHTTAHGFANGYYCLKFNYYSDANAYNGGNTSPGIRLVDFKFVRAELQDLTEGAAVLDGWYSSSQECVIVIVNVGNIHASPDWITQFTDFRSWRMTKNVAGVSKNYSYAGVITNVNDIGQLSEALQGVGSGAANATTQLVIEHDKNTMGHAGYGEDLSSGTGAGEFSYTGLTSSTIASKTIPWDSAGKDRVLKNEKLRITVFNKVEGGAAHWAGYMNIKLFDGGTQYNYIMESVDVFKKFEFLHTRQSNLGTGDLEVEIFATAGSGNGAGAPYDNVSGRNLEIYKAGFNPDQERDVAVHKWHINALNITEGPVDFDIAKGEVFSVFYASDRNLVDQSYVYPLNMPNSGNTQWQNHFYNGGSLGSTGIGAHNEIRFGEYRVNSTQQTTGVCITEVRQSQSNQSFEQPLGWDPNTSSQRLGLRVDSSKVYMAGCWLRVRDFTTLGSAQAPGRISLVTSANQELKGYDGTLYSTGTKITGPSISDYPFQPYDGNNGQWRLFTIFYLPHWMTDTQITEWHDDYFGKWAGEYEFGGGFAPSRQIVDASHGIAQGIDARVIQMTSGINTVYPQIRTEVYQDQSIWHEALFPFLTEIDPMNLTAGGDAHFWDFTEA